MRQVLIDVFDCKDDKEWPADEEIVEVFYNGVQTKAMFQKLFVICGVYDDTFWLHNCQKRIKFTDADEWYRPIGGK